MSESLIPFDADFDAPSNPIVSPTVFASPGGVSSRQAFLFGLAFGVMGSATIGFVILLARLF